MELVAENANVDVGCYLKNPSGFRSPTPVVPRRRASAAVSGILSPQILVSLRNTMNSSGPGRVEPLPWSLYNDAQFGTTLLIQTRSHEV